MKPTSSTPPASASPMARLVDAARLGREKADADTMLAAYSMSDLLINVGAEPQLPVVGGDKFAESVRAAFARGLPPARREVTRAAEWASADGRYAAWAGDVIEHGKAAFVAADGARSEREYHLPLALSAFARRAPGADGQLEIVLWRVGAALEGAGRIEWGERFGKDAKSDPTLELGLAQAAAERPFAAVAMRVLALERADGADALGALLERGALVVAAGGSGGQLQAAASFAAARAADNLAGRTVELLALVGQTSESADASWVMLDMLERNPGGTARALRVSAAAVRSGGAWKIVLLHEAVPAVMGEVAAQAVTP